MLSCVEHEKSFITSGPDFVACEIIKLQTETSGMGSDLQKINVKL